MSSYGGVPLPRGVHRACRRENDDTFAQILRQARRPAALGFDCLDAWIAKRRDELPPRSGAPDRPCGNGATSSVQKRWQTKLRSEVVNHEWAQRDARYESTEQRQRFFTLLVRDYEEVRRAVTFVRWHDGDAHHIPPALFVTSRPRRRRDRELVDRGGVGRERSNAMGTLVAQGTLNPNQFWSTGTSDGDTAQVEVERVTFEGELSHAFEYAQVRGRVRKPVIDAHGRMTVRFQGFDAPELHYMPTVASALGCVRQCQYLFVRRRAACAAATRAMGTRNGEQDT